MSAPIGLGLWILAFHGMTQTSVNLFLPLLLQVVHGVSPVFVNFLSIIISCGWTIGTFTVSGWSGMRERVALMSGPVLAFTGPRLPDRGRVAAGPGLAGGEHPADGARHRHLQRAPGRPHVMATADAREQRSTASALTSVRSLGTAFGAAIAGVVASTAGLGDATEPQAVGHAVTAVYVVLLGSVRSRRDVHVPLYSPHRAGSGSDALPAE